MKKNIFLTIGFILIIAATPAAAQSDDTAEFVKAAVANNMFQIQSSKALLTKSESELVRNFAQAISLDHARSGKKMTALLNTSDKEYDVPQRLDAEHQQKIDDLLAASTEDIDTLYIEEQIAAHEKALALFDNYATEGDNPTWRCFASQSLPMWRMHENRAKRLQEME